MAMSFCGMEDVSGWMRRRDKGDRDRYPALIPGWHPDKNGELTPWDVTPGSGKHVWWRCPKAPDHEWRTRVYRRWVQGRGCPMCVGQRVVPSTSLATLRPDIARQWHPDRNGALTPRDVVPGSNKRVWWKCSEGPDHEWATTIKSRAGRETGCPVCSGRVIVPSASLAVLHPEIAVWWHPTRNGTLTPIDVSPRCSLSVWWLCPRGSDHEWTVRSP